MSLGARVLFWIPILIPLEGNALKTVHRICRRSAGGYDGSIRAHRYILRHSLSWASRDCKLIARGTYVTDKALPIAERNSSSENGLDKQTFLHSLRNFWVLSLMTSPVMKIIRSESRGFEARMRS